MSTRVPNGWGDPSTERHLQVPPRHATGSRAPDPDELARIEKNLRDEVRRRLNEETPDRAATRDEEIRRIALAIDAAYDRAGGSLTQEELAEAAWEEMFGA